MGCEGAPATACEIGRLQGRFVSTGNAASFRTTAGGHSLHQCEPPHWTPEPDAVLHSFKGGSRLGEAAKLRLGGAGPSLPDPCGQLPTSLPSRSRLDISSCRSRPGPAGSRERGAAQHWVPRGCRGLGALLAGAWAGPCVQSTQEVVAPGAPRFLHDGVSCKQSRCWLTGRGSLRFPYVQAAWPAARRVISEPVGQGLNVHCCYLCGDGPVIWFLSG